MITPISTQTISEICKRQDDMLISLDDMKELSKRGKENGIDKFVKEIKDWQKDIQDNEKDADRFDFIFERIYEIAEDLKEA